MKARVLIFLSAFLIFSCKGETDAGFTDDFSAESYAVENAGAAVSLNPDWTFAGFSKINTGCAYLYRAAENRNNITVAVNAGHGTAGGSAVKTYSHPDKSPKVTGGTNAEGAVESTAVSAGMTFSCGLSEAEGNLRTALILRKMLLESGFDVLMIRETDDVQLDNIARTVISNNSADIHVAVHYDGDGRSKDKGVFYCGVPDELKYLENVAAHCAESERLGAALVAGLKDRGLSLYNGGRTDTDLTQTSYSTIPTVDIELGNQSTLPTTENLETRARGVLDGVRSYFRL